MDTTPEFQILTSLKEPGVSVDAVVQQLLHLTSAAAILQVETTVTVDSGSGPLSTHINNVWRALVEDLVAHTVPDQQAAQVDFVRKLHKQEVIDPSTGEILRYYLVPNYHQAVWSDLPLFGISVMDEWNFDPNRPDPSEEPLYYNKICFLAQLANCPENNVPDPQSKGGPFDFSPSALRELGSAFECAAEDDASNLIRLRAASLWMIYCADRLWANTRMKRKTMHDSESWNPRKEWNGFHPDRWRIWVGGLKEGLEIGDGETKVLVERALKEVQRVEDQSWRIAEEERYK